MREPPQIRVPAWKRVGAGVTLAVIVAAVAAVVIVVVLAVTSVNHAYSHQPKTTTNSACLTNAPGGKLCGQDAKDFCQNMKIGQTISPARIDRITRRQCADLGVKGLR